MKNYNEKFYEKNSDINQNENGNNADIIEFKTCITQFELTKLVYESEIFAKIKLTASSKLFLWALCTHFNPEKADMFPSQQTVAKRLGMSVKSAERAVKELKDKGLVEYETKRVNHYKFSEKFFKLVKMSVELGQNVGSKYRQNVGLTNKSEQKRNKANFSFSQKGNSKNCGYAKNEYAKTNELQGSKAVPSIEETQEYFRKMEEDAKNSFNPWDYSKADAEAWLEKVNPRWMQRSPLAKHLIKKYGFEKYYDNCFGRLEGNVMRKYGANVFDSLTFEEQQRLINDEISAFTSNNDDFSNNRENANNI